SRSYSPIDNRRSNRRDKERDEDRPRRRERSKQRSYEDDERGRSYSPIGNRRSSRKEKEHDEEPPRRLERSKQRSHEDVYFSASDGKERDGSENGERSSRAALRTMPTHYRGNRRDSSPIPRGFRRSELLNRDASRDGSPIPRGFRRMDEEQKHGRTERPPTSPSSDEQRLYRLSLLDRSSESPPRERRKERRQQGESSREEQRRSRAPVRALSVPRRHRSGSPDYWAMADKHERGSKQWLRTMILSVLNA
ncbi:hypothetical protein PMAYCL1PPCAC_20845, partial [Pristionchus mayeri]